MRVSCRVTASQWRSAKLNKVLAAAHGVQGRPIEERLVVVIRAAAAPFILPNEFAVFAGEVF
jgi:hypothetical protein